MPNFSDYNPGFASPDSIYMQMPGTVQAPQQAAAPLPPPPMTIGGLPQSAWSQALHTGMAGGQGVRQIMAGYNPGMFGHLYKAPDPVLNPAQALMNPTPAPAPEQPMGMMSGPASTMPTPPMPAPRPGLERMYGRYPGVARRMGYQPVDAYGQPIPAPGQNRNDRRGR